MQIDTLYTINTPEGIALRLAPAGLVPRMLAWLIDLLLRGAVSALILVTLALLGKMGTGLAWIFIFLLEWLYPVWFELRHYGQTPGKKMFRLYVVNADASPVTPAASMIRNLLRVVDFLPLMYGFAIISLLFTRRFQRLGDLAANTIVLHKAENNAVPALDNVAAIQPPVSLTPLEQQTLLQFAQRQRTLTPARSEELAQLVSSLVPNQAEARHTLLGYAHWIAGSTSNLQTTPSTQQSS